MMKRFRSVLLILVVLLVAGTAQAGYYDFGGATVTIFSQGNPAGRFVEGIGSPAVPAYGLHIEAEALFNCRIEFLASDFLTFPEIAVTRLLSGDASHDIWNINTYHYFLLLAQGMLFPVNEVLPESYFEALPGLARGTADYLTFRGERYGFGAVNSLHGMIVVVYSRNVLDELGLPDLQELYYAGEWTWDAMEDIAREATRQGEDGSVLYGISGLVDSPFFHGFAYTNNEAAWVREVDGQMLFAANSPEFLEALNRVRSWVDAGIARPMVNRNPDQRALVEGDLAMSVVNMSRFYNVGVRDYELSNERYGMVPLPRGPQADGHVVTAEFLGGRVLPVTAEHPEGLIQLAEFLYPAEDYRLEVESVINLYAQDRSTAQLLWEVHDNALAWTTPMNHAQAGMAPTRDRLADVLLGRRTAAAAMDEVAQEQQTILDDLWNF